MSINGNRLDPASGNTVRRYWLVNDVFQLKIGRRVLRMRGTFTYFLFRPVCLELRWYLPCIIVLNGDRRGDRAVLIVFAAQG